MKKLKYFIPSILLMILIFIFSNQTGNESSNLSGQIVLWIQANLHISIPELFIRKAAHMSEYAILTMTFIYGFYKSELKQSRIFAFSLLSTFLYACTDEIHQLFIGGRSGQLTDVFIDTSGGILAIFFVYLISYFYKRKSAIHK